jgi:hypothetical protein
VALNVGHGAVAFDLVVGIREHFHTNEALADGAEEVWGIDEVEGVTEAAGVEFKDGLPDAFGIKLVLG